MTIRLSVYQHKMIKLCFQEVFQAGEVYLFGSRVDLTRKGGDIDLYLIPVDQRRLLHKKIQFLARLKRSIGEQKIDVVFASDQSRLIDQIARQQGVLL